jgi:hypothetical protein
MNTPNKEAIIQDEGGCACCSGKVTPEEVIANNQEHIDDGYVKMRIALPDGGGENLWTKRTDKPDEFEVSNTPFFTQAFGCGDIVRAEEHKPGFSNFIEVVKRVRETICLTYLIEHPEEELQRRFVVLLEELRAKGYTAEGMVAGYMVVGVPYGEGRDGVAEVIANTKSGLEVSFYEEPGEKSEAPEQCEGNEGG